MCVCARMQQRLTQFDENEDVWFSFLRWEKSKVRWDEFPHLQLCPLMSAILYLFYCSGNIPKVAVTFPCESPIASNGHAPVVGVTVGLYAGLPSFYAEGDWALVLLYWRHVFVCICKCIYTGLIAFLKNTIYIYLYCVLFVFLVWIWIFWLA